MATFEQLREAREQTRRMAERDELRPLRRSIWGDHKINWPSLRIPREVPIWAQTRTWDHRADLGPRFCSRLQLFEASAAHARRSVPQTRRVEFRLASRDSCEISELLMGVCGKT